ncbi:hypothetical protein HU200_042414 [Digitaria exilis]|uniref:Cytochrome P450 n=1 Tax=Digitaria exilis TaxID=1010633 RepID=A0A835B5V2_9POAL|nr:hypothetical protein HU200_042414 [Digitaria exilis]
MAYTSAAAAYRAEPAFEQSNLLLFRGGERDELIRAADVVLFKPAANLRRHVDIPTKGDNHDVDDSTFLYHGPYLRLAMDEKPRAARKVVAGISPYDYKYTQAGGGTLTASPDMETLLQLLWIGLATLVFVALLRRSTRHAPFSLTLPTIEIRDPAVARRLLFDHADDFSNRPNPFPLDFSAGRNHSISTVPYGPAWRTLRRSLTADILHPTRLGLMKPLQREAVECLVSGLSVAAGEEEVVVVRGSLRCSAYALMSRLCFGDGTVDARDTSAIDRAQHEFLALVLETVAMLRRCVPSVVQDRGHSTNGCIQLAQRRSSGGILPYVDSLRGLRVAGDRHEDDKCRVDTGPRMLMVTEMAPLVWEFIVAGAESVASSVEWALAHLVTQPEVQNKLYREVVPDESLRSTPYLRAVVLECLRMHPTVPLIVREVGAQQGTKVGGAAAGTTTTRFSVMASDIGRNGKVWTDPDAFRPERFVAGGEGECVGPIPGPKEIKMMPFGAGRRHCPGAGMGMVHIACFLAALVREFEWAPSADSGGAVDFEELDVFFKVMKTPLRLRIAPRSGFPVVSTPLLFPLQLQLAARRRYNHYRKLALCRVFLCLPSARSQALGKLLIMSCVSDQTLGKNKHSELDKHCTDDTGPNGVRTRQTGQHLYPLHRLRHMIPEELREGSSGARYGGHQWAHAWTFTMVHIACFPGALVREFEWAPSAESGGAVDFEELDVFFKVMKTPLKVRIAPRR